MHLFIWLNSYFTWTRFIKFSLLISYWTFNHCHSWMILMFFDENDKYASNITPIDVRYNEIRKPKKWKWKIHFQHVCIFIPSGSSSYWLDDCHYKKNLLYYSGVLLSLLIGISYYTQSNLLFSICNCTLVCRLFLLFLSFSFLIDYRYFVYNTFVFFSFSSSYVHLFFS